MPHLLPRLAPVLLALLFFPACRTSDAPASATPPPHPAIAGDWSEPVNGLRMGVRHVVSGTAGGDVWLLILVENTTAREVAWPGIISEPDVQFHGQPAGRSHTVGANLRVAVEPLDGQPIHADDLRSLSAMMRQYQTLAPGEIRLHAIRLHRAEMQQQLQQDRNQVYADSVYWPGLGDRASSGRWRLHLTFRPDGFPPPPGEEWAERADVLIGWEERQIDLPPLEIEVWSDGESQRREELRQR